MVKCTTGMPNDASQDLTEHACCMKSESVDSDSQLDSIIEQIMILSKSIPASGIEQKADPVLTSGSNFSALAKSLVEKHLMDLSVSHPSPLKTLPESSQTDYPVDKRLTEIADALRESVPAALKKLNQNCESKMTGEPILPESNFAAMDRSDDIAVLCSGVRNLQRLTAVHQRIVNAFNETKQFVEQSIQQAQLRVLTKDVFRISRDQAERFYAEHKGRFYYDRLVNHMICGPLGVYVLKGPDAISVWRSLLGPTKVYRAVISEPTSLRGRFGLTDTRNGFHGSDSMETALKEIRFFFPLFGLEQSID